MLKLFGLGLTLGAFFICGATIIDCGSAQDKHFVGGTTYTISSPVSDVTLRFGSSFRYSIPVNPGRYSVTLRFVEPNQTKPGQRIFSASINGTLVVDRLDLVAVAGPLAMHSRTVEATATSMLDIAFVTQVRSAVVSAIEYTQLADIPPPAQTQIQTGAGLISWTVNGVMTIGVDTAYIVNLHPADEPVPNVGDGCRGGMIVRQEAVYFCAPVLPLSANPNPWGRWIRLVAQ